MKRSMLVIAAVTIAAPLALAAPGQAAVAPTVSGPSTTPYYAEAKLSGTTPLAGAETVLHVRDSPTSAWRVGRTVRSDANRHWTTTLTMRHDWTYYVSANDARSAVRTTRVVTASCKLGGRAFRNPMLARSDKPLPGADNTYTVLTATRNGLWAGYAFSSYPLEFDAITWRHGQKTPTVLARYRYRGSGNFAPNEHGSLDVVGISPSGTVVAAVQTKLNGTRIDYMGVAWRKGHTYHLARSPRWRSVRPIAVTDTGAIIGQVLTSGGWAVVRWANPRATYSVLLPATTHGHRDVAADQRGDVVYEYNAKSGDDIWVRKANGARFRLVGRTVYSPPGITVLAQGTRVFASLGSGQGVWDIERSPSGGDMPPTAALTGNGAELRAVAAGRDGGVLFGDWRYAHKDRMYYRTPKGAFVRAPALGGHAGTVGAAVDSAGNVAITSPKDGLVHFFRCS